MIITETPREGWTVASEAGETIALDLHLTDELIRAGLAREVVRFLQESRKNAGFDISDRIEVRWASADPAVAAAVGEHAQMIADEVLAISFEQGTGDGYAASSGDLQLEASLRRLT